MAPLTCEHQGMDLTSADWWVRTTVKRLQDIDPNLRFSYVYVPATNTSHLHVDNISEQSLSKLAFMVNTNSNNNYGYFMLIDLKTYKKIEIPLNKELNIGFHSIFVNKNLK